MNAMTTEFAASATAINEASTWGVDGPNIKKLVLQDLHHHLLAAAFATIFPDTPEAKMLTARAQLMTMGMLPLSTPESDEATYMETRQFWEKVDALETPFRGVKNSLPAVMLQAVLMLQIELEQSDGEDPAALDLVRSVLALASQMRADDRKVAPMDIHHPAMEH